MSMTEATFIVLPMGIATRFLDYYQVSRLYRHTSGRSCDLGVDFLSSCYFVFKSLMQHLSHFSQHLIALFDGCMGASTKVSIVYVGYYSVESGLRFPASEQSSRLARQVGLRERLYWNRWSPAVH